MLAPSKYKLIHDRESIAYVHWAMFKLLSNTLNRLQIYH